MIYLDCFLKVVHDCPLNIDKYWTAAFIAQKGVLQVKRGFFYKDTVKDTRNERITISDSEQSESYNEHVHDLCQ